MAKGESRNVNKPPFGGGIMDTLERIRNTMRSFEGRMRSLENDPDLDLKGYCDRAAALEHDFYNVIKNILKQTEKDKEVSSVELARSFGLISNKD